MTPWHAHIPTPEPPQHPDDPPPTPQPPQQPPPKPPDETPPVEDPPPPPPVGDPPPDQTPNPPRYGGAGPTIFSGRTHSSYWAALT
jgi:hypothetical protein